MLTACAVAPGQQTDPMDTTAETELLIRNLNQLNQHQYKDFGLAYIEQFGFNPYSCVCITNRPVCSLVYEGLFVLNSSYQPQPVLCDRFAVSENGKTYVLTLCDGVTFSDGSPLTTRDVVASLEAARDSEFYGNRFSKVAAFTAKDDRTLEISLYKAYENLPAILDVPIVKAGTVKDQRPLGSGPYAFSQEESGLCLRRNQSWWQQNRAPVEYDTILLTAAMNPTEVRDSFEFGATSLVCADLNAPNAVGYRCDYELWDCPTTILQYIGFNLNAGEFYNRSLRTAITHIIDRESLITSVYKGFAEPAYLPCAAASPFYEPELAESYGYDPEAFAQGLRQARISDGYVGTLLICSGDPARLEMAYRIAEALTEAGLKMEVKALDRNTYLYRINQGKYDMFIGEARLSGNFDLTEFFKKYGSLCVGGIQSAGMEQLCYDALENSGNCYDLYKSVMENGYFCPLLFKSYAVMANRGVIGSLQPAVDNVFQLAAGRTLADASVPWEELTQPQPAESTEATQESEEVLP